jgi:hypothetical protein
MTAIATRIKLQAFRDSHSCICASILDSGFSTAYARPLGIRLAVLAQKRVFLFLGGPHLLNRGSQRLSAHLLVPGNELRPARVFPTTDIAQQNRGQNDSRINRNLLHSVRHPAACGATTMDDVRHLVLAMPKYASLLGRPDIGRFRNG